ncbi:MAG: hypothetical protein ACRDPI_05985 [Nocardioidaceae bacterium]
MSSATDWAAVAAALVAAGTSAFAAMTVQRMQSRQEYRSALHQVRLSEYQAMFQILEPLSVDGRDPPDDETRKKIAAEITNWYYAQGGLVMSEEIREALLSLRSALVGVTDRQAFEEEMRKQEPLRGLASDLRQALTEEVLSRDEPA